MFKWQLKKQEQKNISQEQEQQLLLNGISLTKDIIRSVYRGEENYTYEVLLFILAINDDENNLYKGYFPFEEDKGFIFPLDKSNEVLIQVFGEKEYTSLEDLFDYDEESNIYYKNLAFSINDLHLSQIPQNCISERSMVNLHFAYKMSFNSLRGFCCFSWSIS